MAVNFRDLVSLIDIAGALAIIALMVETTRSAGMSSIQNKWSLVRRLIYAGVAMALFARGMLEFDSYSYIDWKQALTEVTLIAAIVFFPLMRACGLISQDTWRT